MQETSNGLKLAVFWWKSDERSVTTFHVPSFWLKK